MRSQNGWPVLESHEVKQWKIPGFGRTLPLVPGRGGFVLVHFAAWFDKKIESLDIVFDDWGYAKRKIGGSDDWSNHASATAVDLNATRHPQGRSDTFSKAQAALIRSVLAERYNSKIRWGGDYRGTPDDMHFELADSEPELEAVAKKLHATRIGKRIVTLNQ